MPRLFPGGGRCASPSFLLFCASTTAARALPVLSAAVAVAALSTDALSSLPHMVFGAFLAAGLALIISQRLAEPPELKPNHYFLLLLHALSTFTVAAAFLFSVYLLGPLPAALLASADFTFLALPPLLRRWRRLSARALAAALLLGYGAVVVAVSLAPPLGFDEHLHHEHLHHEVSLQQQTQQLHAGGASASASAIASAAQGARPAHASKAAGSTAAMMSDTGKSPLPSPKKLSKNNKNSSSNSKDDDGDDAPCTAPPKEDPTALPPCAKAPQGSGSPATAAAVHGHSAAHSHSSAHGHGHPAPAAADHSHPASRSRYLFVPLSLWGAAAGLLAAAAARYRASLTRTTAAEMASARLVTSTSAAVPAAAVSGMTGVKALSAAAVLTVAAAVSPVILMAPMLARLAGGGSGDETPNSDSSNNNSGANAANSSTNNTHSSGLEGLTAEIAAAGGLLWLALGVLAAVMTAVVTGLGTVLVPLTADWELARLWAAASPLPRLSAAKADRFTSSRSVLASVNGNGRDGGSNGNDAYDDDDDDDDGEDFDADADSGSSSSGSSSSSSSGGGGSGSVLAVKRLYALRAAVIAPIAAAFVVELTALTVSAALYPESPEGAVAAGAGGDLSTPLAARVAASVPQLVLARLSQGLSVHVALAAFAVVCGHWLLGPSSSSSSGSSLGANSNAFSVVNASTHSLSAGLSSALPPTVPPYAAALVDAAALAHSEFPLSRGPRSRAAAKHSNSSNNSNGVNDASAAAHNGSIPGGRSRVRWLALRGPLAELGMGRAAAAVSVGPWLRREQARARARGQGWRYGSGGSDRADAEAEAAAEAEQESLERSRGDLSDGGGSDASGSDGDDDDDVVASIGVTGSAYNNDSDDEDAGDGDAGDQFIITDTLSLLGGSDSSSSNAANTASRQSTRSRDSRKSAKSLLHKRGGAGGGGSSGCGGQARRVWRHIRSSRDAQRLFLFLSLNFLFMFVEAAYGAATNSLGLISDAGHMLFDSVALAIGLYAAAVASARPDAAFNYSYSRVETLSGFANGVFLVFIGFFVLVEGVQRLFETPVIRSDQLLTVSVLGFVVNVIGLVFFHDHAHGGAGGGQCSHGHSHGGGGSSSHSGHSGHNVAGAAAHGHSHGSAARCSHSHDDHGHDHGHGNGSGDSCSGHDHGDDHCDGHNDHGHHSGVSGGAPVVAVHTVNHNMEGVFLHILADALGSVGVICSAVLIRFWGLTAADAWCSIVISLLILASVAPLVKNSGAMLLMQIPEAVGAAAARAVARLEAEAEAARGDAARGEAARGRRTASATAGLVRVRRLCLWVAAEGDVRGEAEVIAQAGSDCEQVRAVFLAALNAQGVPTSTATVAHTVTVQVFYAFEDITNSHTAGHACEKLSLATSANNAGAVTATIAKAAAVDAGHWQGLRPALLAQGVQQGQAQTHSYSQSNAVGIHGHAHVHGHSHSHGASGVAHFG